MLTQITAEYSMSAKMWWHKIYSFFKIMCHWLSESLNHMLTFIHIVYFMMALLYETLSAFENTWIECLSNLNQYYMIIKNDNHHNCQIWLEISHFWYWKAVNSDSTIDCLYHHLIILVCTYTFKQLNLYVRSLTSVQLFTMSQSSIMTCFNFFLIRKNEVPFRVS